MRDKNRPKTLPVVTWEYHPRPAAKTPLSRPIATPREVHAAMRVVEDQDKPSKKSLASGGFQIMGLILLGVVMWFILTLFIGPIVPLP